MLKEINSCSPKISLVRSLCAACSQTGSAVGEPRFKWSTFTPRGRRTPRSHARSGERRASNVFISCSRAADAAPTSHMLPILSTQAVETSEGTLQSVEKLTDEKKALETQVRTQEVTTHILKAARRTRGDALKSV